MALYRGYDLRAAQLARTPRDKQTKQTTQVHELERFLSASASFETAGHNGGGVGIGILSRVGLQATLIKLL